MTETDKKTIGESIIYALLLLGIFAYVYGGRSDPKGSDFSVLTEVGQAKEARYQEWKEREDESRTRQREQERFQKRYKNENERTWIK